MRKNILVLLPILFMISNLSAQSDSSPKSKKNMIFYFMPGAEFNLEQYNASYVLEQIYTEADCGKGGLSVALSLKVGIGNYVQYERKRRRYGYTYWYPIGGTHWSDVIVPGYGTISTELLNSESVEINVRSLDNILKFNLLAFSEKNKSDDEFTILFLMVGKSKTKNYDKANYNVLFAYEPMIYGLEYGYVWKSKKFSASSFGLAFIYYDMPKDIGLSRLPNYSLNFTFGFGFGL